MFPNRQIDRSDRTTDLRRGPAIRGGLGGLPEARARQLPLPQYGRRELSNNRLPNRYNQLEHLDRAGDFTAPDIRLYNGAHVVNGTDSNTTIDHNVTGNSQSEINAQQNEKIDQLQINAHFQERVIAHLERSIYELWEAKDKSRDAVDEIRISLKQLVDIYPTNIGEQESVDPAALSFPQLSG